MFNKFFNFQTKTIQSAAVILSLSALVSRVLGLFRDRLLASTFGAGADLDVYFAAFRLPDFIYNILIAGGIVVAFVPLFSEYFIKDKKEAWDFTNNLLNVFLFFLVLISLAVGVFAPFFVKIMTPGFNAEQLDLTVLLTRILFLSPIFLGLSSLFSGIAQYFNKFFIYSLAPILYNLGIIFGIVFLAPTRGILGVTVGVVIGALLHFLIQVPAAVQAGFSYQPIFNLKDAKINKVFSLMIPRTFGVAAPQINLMVVTAIASVLSSGALSIFTLANNLQQFPLGLVGIPFAMAAFPALAQAWAAQKKEEFMEKYSSTFRKILYLIVPLSLLIFFLRNQIILIYRAGKYGGEAASLTAASLGLFALGIFASCLIPLVFRAFFAFQDTKTPTIIAVVALLLNVVLCLGFVWALEFPNFFQEFMIKLFALQGIKNISVIGLPLAFSVDSILQLIFLVYFLNRKINKNFNVG